jgi:hypothetical protein
MKTLLHECFMIIITMYNSNSMRGEKGKERKIKPKTLN